MPKRQPDARFGPRMEIMAASFLIVLTVLAESARRPERCQPSGPPKSQPHKWSFTMPIACMNA